jgi:hypothetical protein
MLGSFKSPGYGFATTRKPGTPMSSSLASLGKQSPPPFSIGGYTVNPAESIRGTGGNNPRRQVTPRGYGPRPQFTYDSTTDFRYPNMRRFIP